MFNFEKISASKLAASPSVERVVEFSPPGVETENIAKVLSLAVDGKAISVTAFDGYADVEGRANFKLVYVDAEGVPKGVDYNADFSVKVEGDISADDILLSKIEIVETDVTADGSLLLSAVIDVSVNTVKRCEFEALTEAEQCYKTLKKALIPEFIATKTSVLQVYDEISVGEVESILLVDSSVIIRKATAEDNLVRVEGTVYASVTFAESGEIKAKTLEIPLSDEIAVDGVRAGDKVSADAVIRNSRIVLQGVTGDNIIRYESDAAITLRVFRDRETELIGDMFMLTNEVDIKRAKNSFVCLDDCKYFSERVSGTAVLSDNRAAARDIIALPYARCYTSRADSSEDGLTVEGLVNTDIIYRDENGYNSVRAEIPFSVTLPGDFATGVKVSCCIEEIAARVKRDREIEVNLTLGIQACEYTECEAEYICEVELGAEKEQNTSALSLYIVSDGDEMWDVCKALTATPEEILKQNPTLTLPLADGERIIYFRSLA